MSDQSTEEELWQASAVASGIERAEILQLLGSRLYERAAYDQAAAAAASAAELFRSGGRVAELARCCFGQASSYEALGRRTEAISSFKEAGALFAEQADEHGSADCCSRVARLLAEEGDLDGALAGYSNAEALYRSSGDESRYAETAMNRGEVLGNLGRQKEALDAFRAARERFRRLADAHKVAWADDRIAAALIDLGNFDEAIDHLLAALDVAETCGEPAFVAHSRYRLGWTLEIAGRHDEALEQLSAARAGFTELDDLLGTARCDLHRADTLTNLGRAKEAIPIYRRVRSVFDACGRDDDVAITEVNLANAFENEGDLLSSTDLLQKVVERARSQGDGYLLATASCRLAKDLLGCGRAEDALSVLNGAGNFFSGTDNVPEGALFEVTRARALQLTGRIEEAGVIAGAVVERLESGTFPAVLAEAYEILSNCARTVDDSDRTELLSARAIALYLADGRDDEARKLGRVLLAGENGAR